MFRAGLTWRTYSMSYAHCLFTFQFTFDINFSNSAKMEPYLRIKISVNRSIQLLALKSANDRLDIS